MGILPMSDGLKQTHGQDQFSPGCYGRQVARATAGIQTQLPTIQRWMRPNPMGTTALRMENSVHLPKSLKPIAGLVVSRMFRVPRETFDCAILTT